MICLLRSYKTELDVTEKQADKINQTIGVCRYMYNFYLTHSKLLYEQGQSFMSGRIFSVWFNNEYLPEHPELSWVKSVSSKSVKQSIENAYTAFRRFFEKRSGYPCFKKKGISDPKIYFVKNNPKDCLCERHRIKIPTLGWVKIKEKGYIPTTKQGFTIRSGTITKQAGRYYISVLVEIPDIDISKFSYSDGIGIDLGLKEFAVCSNGIAYQNINKTAIIRTLEKRLRREQRKFSRKHEALKKSKKGKAAQRLNITKQKRKIQRIHQRLTNIRTDYINKVIAEIVRAKPSYITIEDLNVQGLMKNRHLSKSVASQKFYEFRRKLQQKCKEYGIELRIADRFYPSSKTCHHCGIINHALKLSERTYKCLCGYEADRDYNASLNLRDTTIYKLA